MCSSVPQSRLLIRAFVEAGLKPGSCHRLRSGRYSDRFFSLADVNWPRRFAIPKAISYDAMCGAQMPQEPIWPCRFRQIRHSERSEESLFDAQLFAARQRVAAGERGRIDGN
jgi:hypothetical protein